MSYQPILGLLVAWVDTESTDRGTVGALFLCGWCTMRKFLSWKLYQMADVCFDAGMWVENLFDSIGDAVGWVGYRCYNKCLKWSESLQGNSNDGPWER